MNAVCDPHWEAASAPGAGRAVRPDSPAAHASRCCSTGIQPVAGGLCVRGPGCSRGSSRLRTAVPARGRGYGRAVVRRLAAWARGMGARQLYLQVEDDNAPARALLAPLGAQAAYGYWYRELDAQAA